MATNNERARWANAALSAFILEVGDAGDDEISTADLICDIRHLCDAQGWSFDKLIASSQKDYEVESNPYHPEGGPKADSDFAS